jgi:hypothetical protein
MVLRPPVILALMLLVLAILAGVALLVPRGGERLVARATSKVPAQTLRDCLGGRMGLTWSGDPRAMHASAFGLRVVVSDSGQSRQLGLFTNGGRPLSSSESDTVKACLSGQ